jgi:hypothetical protein
MSRIPHRSPGEEVLLRIGLLVGAMVLLVVVAMTSVAQATPSEFGIQRGGASVSTTDAGRHPDLLTEIDFKAQVQPYSSPENLKVELPSGLLSNRQNFPECPLLNFNDPVSNPCPVDSQIGTVKVGLVGLGSFREPLFNLPTSEDEFIRLGFYGLLFPLYLDISLRSDSDYGVTIKSQDIPSALPIESIHTNVWGVPADESHDTERLTVLEAFLCENGKPCLEPEEKRSTEAVPIPFMSNPVNCGPMPFDYQVTTYLLPGRVFQASTNQEEITDCDQVPFEPTFTFSTTSRKAGAPTGLEATLTIPQNEGVETVNSSPLRRSKVVLPEGMTINPASANGLGSCSVEQANFGKLGPGNCPNDSKIGTARILSPNLEREIEGGLYLRTPEPDHLTRFWLISNELGLDLKIPAEVERDPNTGRLTTVIPQAPQLPAEVTTLRFNGGPRAALKNPEKCGTYAIDYELTPWSGNPPVSASAPIEVTEGCDTGGFSPKLSAGTMDPTAGRFSPFVFDLSREDGEQNVASLDVDLPKGLTAKLAGVQPCPEGGAPIANCPAASQIGVVKTAVGAGALPLWVPQPGREATAAYLGGPYRGAPYSLIAKVPAQAGPFDLGTVAVRSAIELDPDTAKVSVSSDPLPQILQGIPVTYRHVRVEANRPGFTLNPTSCEPQQVAASVRSNLGATAKPTDRFQAVECAALGFKPKLAMSLFGPTERGGHPALHAVLNAPVGQANLREASIALPRSEFLDQSHIGTVCTRVQFAAHACPAKSIYGEVQAITPLLDEPLEGPVYLRSSSHKLPDLVLALRGPNGLEVDAAARADSIRGGIRVSFEGIPDVPVSKVIVDMKGGNKGLLQNSTGLCAHAFKATAAFDAQNGRIRDLRPVLKPGCKIAVRHRSR